MIARKSSLKFRRRLKSTQLFLLRTVSNTSVKKSTLCSFIDLSALKIEASAKQSKKTIEQTKNNLFHALSGNGP